VGMPGLSRPFPDLWKPPFGVGRPHPRLRPGVQPFRRSTLRHTQDGWVLTAKLTEDTRVIEFWAWFLGRITLRVDRNSTAQRRRLATPGPGNPNSLHDFAGAVQQFQVPIRSLPEKGWASAGVIIRHLVRPGPQQPIRVHLPDVPPQRMKVLPLRLASHP